MSSRYCLKLGCFGMSVTVVNIRVIDLLLVSKGIMLLLSFERNDVITVRH